MFWACTHVTLRNSELPLFLERGVEVIPEEVNLVVVDPLEARRYEDENLPINAAWRKATTLAQSQLRICRRARLSQRGGRVTAREADAFNAAFDVIYIATDLQAAVNIASWFEGVVLFRYFGAYMNLQSIRDMASRAAAYDVKRIFCVPIFNSLYELGISEFFDRSSVLRGFVTPNDVPVRWQGPRDDQYAVIVLSSLYSGWQSERELRELLPLAEEIPIRVLGKNTLDRVPDDLKAKFDIVGSLEREAYLEDFAAARFILYPHANRHHMHYVPIEAITAGIPVLFRDEIPLILENRARIEELGAKIEGAAPTHQGLLELAKTAYASPDYLGSDAYLVKAVIQGL